MTEKIKYVPKYKNKYIRPERIDALGAQGLTDKKPLLILLGSWSVSLRPRRKAYPCSWGIYYFNC